MGNDMVPFWRRRSGHALLGLALLAAVVVGGVSMAKHIWRTPKPYVEPRLSAGALSVEEIVEHVDKEDAVLLDVGSNDGSQTLAFLRAFPRARIYAFEPDPRAIVSFHKRVKDPRAVLFEFAVGAKDGSTEFFMSDGTASLENAPERPEGWDLSGSIHKPTGHLEAAPWVKFERKITVPLVRLDTWARQNGVEGIDFMWVDIQGAEADLIKGAPQTLERTRFFYTEYSDRQLYEGQVGLRALLELLPDFEVVHRYENDILLRNTRLP
jgi:FkbM family methyltransferase